MFTFFNFFFSFVCCRTNKGWSHETQPIVIFVYDTGRTFLAVRSVSIVLDIHVEYKTEQVLSVLLIKTIKTIMLEDTHPSLNSLCDYIQIEI